MGLWVRVGFWVWVRARLRPRLRVRLRCRLTELVPSASMRRKASSKASTC